MEKIADKCKTFVWKQGRKYYLKEITSNIGNVVIEDDKIICYVNQKKLDCNILRDKYYYDLKLYGTGDNCSIKRQELIKNFKLNKNFYYIFDGIEFYQPVSLSCYFGNVIFRNCSFFKNMEIEHADEVVLENNKHYDSGTSYYFGKCFLSGEIDRLIINRYTFENKSYGIMKDSCPKFGMDVTVKELSIIDSKIKAGNNSYINIKADKSVVSASTIEAPEIYIDSKEMIWVNNHIKASNGVIIENENYDFNGEILSPVIIYNGIDLSFNDEVKIVNIDEAEISEVRQQFTKQLCDLRDYCVLINDNKSVNETLEGKKILVKK